MSVDPTLTIDEIILARNEEEAIIMGGVDGELTCTFPRGYLKRQAVYACKTCAEVTGNLAGICYECSLQCHCDHDVVELYTKRRFRCDCGNSLFKGAAECKLWEEKDDVNEENKYDQTFDGLFCTCARPYPDPEVETELEMFQCGICEDWFHLPHLGLSPDFKPDDNYEEMTCNNCVKKLPLLWLCYYAFLEKHKESINSPEDVNGEPSAKKSRTDTSLVECSDPAEIDGKPCILPEIFAICGVPSIAPDDQSLQNLKINNFTFPSPIFWPTDWRSTALCSCTSCRLTYANMKIDYIMDPEDAIAHYMRVGKQRLEEIESERDSAISTALAEMPHAAAVNVARGINKLKTAISEFLLKGRERGHVVTEEEVKAFCDELKKDML